MYRNYKKILKNPEVCDKINMLNYMIVYEPIPYSNLNYFFIVDVIIFGNCLNTLEENYMRKIKDYTIRVKEIELNGFKNVQHGLVQMPSSFEKRFFEKESDILGIYGQNGSGKTSVVEAMKLIQSLLMGEKLDEQSVNYIGKESNSCCVRVRFSIESSKRKSLVDYTIELEREGDSFILAKETLASSEWNGEKFLSKKTLLDYDATEEVCIFKPKYRYEELVKLNEDARVDLAVAKKLSKMDKRSFIFNSESRKIFLDKAKEKITAEYAYIILALHGYACVDLFVISSEHSAPISMNFFMPVAFRMDHEKGIAKGDIGIGLNEPSKIDNKSFNMMKCIIEEMNIVLEKVIPDMSIGIYDYGEILLDNGEEGHKIELTSKRGEIVIPLSCESEGIIKIISILNVLMQVYNNPSMCLVIDELDSGIFEFLLGELLYIFEKNAKGQIIFTSHNLRALEMMDKKSLIFSTTNPQNRYIRFQNVKNNNNLRDLYLRAITLGGQKEEIYAETDSVEINRAFRRAGKAGANGKK